MLYVCELTLPPAALEAAPVSAWYPICAGTVTRVRVHWPWGAGNLAGARVYQAGIQRWPTTPTRWFGSTCRDLEFAEAYEVSADDPRVLVAGYNLDDTFAHTVTVYIEVMRRNEREYVTELLAYAGVEVASA